MQNGGKRGKGELTPAAVEEEGLGEETVATGRRCCGDRGEDELGDGDLGIFAAVLGDEEVAGSIAVPFPGSSGFRED